MDLGKTGPFKYKPRREKLTLEDDINGIPILDYIAMLGAYRHTQDEAAALLGTGGSTFRAFLAANPAAKDAWKDGRQMCKASVRRLIFVHAKDCSATARFLAKNLLDMTDTGEERAKPEGDLQNGGRLNRKDAEKRILELQAIAIKGPDNSTPGRGLVKRA